MTGAQAAHCGSVSAISLGLPVSTAIPEAKGILPKVLFVGKAPISGKLKQWFVNEIESITMLALGRSANTGLARRDARYASAANNSIFHNRRVWQNMTCGYW